MTKNGANVPLTWADQPTRVRQNIIDKLENAFKCLRACKHSWVAEYICKLKIEHMRSIASYRVSSSSAMQALSDAVPETQPESDRPERRQFTTAPVKATPESSPSPEKPNKRRGKMTDRMKKIKEAKQSQLNKRKAQADEKEHKAAHTAKKRAAAARAREELLKDMANEEDSSEDDDEMGDEQQAPKQKKPIQVKWKGKKIMAIPLND
jgi:FKBP-type peptidyl-prolyl cis-trans isomerase